MKRTKKDKDFVKKPFYKGGNKAMNAFLKKQQLYPEEALKERVEGSVHIRYTISHEGKVIGTKVISGIGSGCDEEAERIVRLLLFEVPKTHKLRVQFHKSIRIHFKLPRPKKPAEQLLQYEVSSNVKQKDEAEDKSDKSYHYQIRW